VNHSGLRADAGRRSAVIAPTGMVATSQPLATAVGVGVLRAGGTAADAAIAANAMLGLVEPMSCGVGGDVFAIVWDARGRRLFGLNGSGRSPFSLTLDVFRDRGLDRVPLRGPLSWSVPGCVDGWSALHERFGRIPMADLLGPAIGYAERGYPVTPIIASMWERAADLLARDPGAAALYLPSGRAPRCGQTFRNPDLARVLRAVAADGAPAFYRGGLAEELVAASEALGGFLHREDLTEHRSTWVDPVSVPYRGYDVWELPPNTQGIAVLEMLRVLEGFDLAGSGHNTAETLHCLVEAKKLAYEDRARFYADPAFYEPPIDRLLSEGYAARQRERIDPSKGSVILAPEDPRLRGGDTVYLTAVDSERNAVSFIQSVYHGFGSGIVPGRLGFALQNRGALFSLDPDHANVLAPHKRPFHTIIPGFVTRDGAPVFSFGVMGGDQQPQGQVQVLVNLIDFHMDVQEAGDAFRFSHDGSSTPTGERMVDGGRLYLEPGIPEAVAADLRKRRHRVAYRGGGYGGYQGIWIDPQTGALWGGSEPRKDGCAIGY